LVVIDRQLDGVGKPPAHRAGDREVLLEVGMTVAAGLPLAIFPGAKPKPIPVYLKI
jgi:hypothetical protein